MKFYNSIKNCLNTYFLDLFLLKTLFQKSFSQFSKALSYASATTISYIKSVLEKLSQGNLGLFYIKEGLELPVLEYSNFSGNTIYYQDSGGLISEEFYQLKGIFVQLNRQIKLQSSSSVIQFTCLKNNFLRLLQKK